MGFLMEQCGLCTPSASDGYSYGGMGYLGARELGDGILIILKAWEAHWTAIPLNLRAIELIIITNK
jgi:hypothetical protein